MSVEECAPLWSDAAFGPFCWGPLLDMIQPPHTESASVDAGDNDGQT